MTESQWRFLKAITERVPEDRIVELRLFPSIRQGGAESGVAVVAVEGLPIAAVAAEDQRGSEAKAGVVERAGVDGAAAGGDPAGSMNLTAGDEMGENGAGVEGPELELADAAVHPGRGAPPDFEDTPPTEFERHRSIAGAPQSNAPADVAVPDSNAPAHVAVPDSNAPAHVAVPDSNEGGLDPELLSAPPPADSDASLWNPPTDRERRIPASVERPMDRATGYAPPAIRRIDDSELEQTVPFDVALDQIASAEDAAPTLDDILELTSGDENLAAAAEASGTRRYAVLAARYRLTLKGPDRGKWDFEMTHEADAPLDTVERVARGVARRAGDEGEAEAFSAPQLRSALAQPWWAGQAT